MAVRQSVLITGCEQQKQLTTQVFRTFQYASCACIHRASPISNHAVMSKWIHNTEQRRLVCFLPVQQPSSPLADSAHLIEVVQSNRTAKKDLLPQTENEQICLEIRCCYLWLSSFEFGLCTAIREVRRSFAGLCSWQTPLLLLSQIKTVMDHVVKDYKLFNVSNDDIWLIAVYSNQSNGFQKWCILAASHEKD